MQRQRQRQRDRERETDRQRQREIERTYGGGRERERFIIRIGSYSYGAQDVASWRTRKVSAIRIQKTENLGADDIGLSPSLKA